MSSSQDSLKDGESEPLVKLAAIDIGSNSIHILIASVDTSLRVFNIDLAEKSTTRLGEVDPDTGNLTVESIDRTLLALSRFKELAESNEVSQILIAATSAVREASNGSEFLKLVKVELGLDIDLITGAEEARLIYLGVLSGMQFGDRPHYLLDIGGGSTELILADCEDARALTSTRIGAVRLKRDLSIDSALSPQRCRFLQQFISGSFEPSVKKVLSRVRLGEKPLLVATSGTAMAIGSIIAGHESSKKIKLHGYKFSREQLDTVVEDLIKIDPKDIASLTHISSRRAEIIIPGALILRTLMTMLGSEDIVISERALREGLIVDWMLRNNLLEDRFSFQMSIRKRTVIHQVKRFSVNRLRAELVAKISLSLYDQTFGHLHTDNGEGRELLWAASMLHSCGQHINLNSYHKHSWYLIRHGELLGYSQSEHLIIAAIARYHRKSLPKKRHNEWQALLSENDRKTVSQMSMILRLSASIDCRTEPIVENVRFNSKPGCIILSLIASETKSNLQLEKWRLDNCARNLPLLSDSKIKIEIFDEG